MVPESTDYKHTWGDTVSRQKHELGSSNDPGSLKTMPFELRKGSFDQDPLLARRASNGAPAFKLVKHPVNLHSKK